MWWSVSDFRDAPMRPRARFDNPDDAQEYAQRFGEHAFIEPSSRDPENDALRVHVLEWKMKARHWRAEAQRLQEECDDLRSRVKEPAL